MQQAIASSGLKEEEYQNNPRVGLIAGSGGGSRASVFGRCDAQPRGLKAAGPHAVTKAMASGVSACLATPFKIHGVNYSSAPLARPPHAVSVTRLSNQLGKQDIVFAGGEELCWEMACEFDAMGALSTKYNDTPEKASRTYDADRDGFVITPAAAVWWWLKNWNTRWRAVRTSTRKSLATAQRPDGADMVAPSGEGAVRCMKMAMQDLDAPIDYINVHAPPRRWATERAGRDSRCSATPRLSPPTKAMTGHSLAPQACRSDHSLLMLEHGLSRRASTSTLWTSRRPA
ncbi:hypothetical protein M8494_03930 [Serratia ureilytica]